MQRKIKSLIKNWIPPALTHVIQGRKGVRWYGDYPSWKEARKLSQGYDSRVILEKVKASLLKVKEGEAAFERDSVLFDEVQYVWPLLAGLLRIASVNNNRLRVLDFGGSLGSSYYRHKNFLSTLSQLRWFIVEQKHFVDCGKQYFEDDHLKFYHDIKACCKTERIDVVLMSSVLPYLEKPYETLKEIMALGVRHVIIDRMPLLRHGEKDRLTLQRVPANIYEAGYPAWFFNRRKFIDFTQKYYRIVAEFECSDQANIDCEFKGFILEKY